jgi:2-haloacid dehalogenase
MGMPQVEALLFDVFGTVVDWRSTVIREGEALGRAHGVTVDWPQFADAWRREGYLGGMARIRQGELPWMRVDALHRRMLDELLRRHGITGLSEEEIAHFTRVWHRLMPWPDAVPGLARLRRRFIVGPLSNGDFALLTNMARAAGLSWDCILSAELFRRYKPAPEVYQGAAALLDLPPDRVMLVAAHAGDLRGARAAGLRTAFVARPLEFGPDAPPAQEPAAPGAAWDVAASDFLDLASQLGA